MANRRKAEGDRRAAARRQAENAATGTHPGRYGRLAIICVSVAVGVVLLVVALEPGDDSRPEPGEMSFPPRPPGEASGIVIPAKAAPATVGGLKQEARQVAEDLLERFPQSAEAHHVMALLESAFRHTDAARKHWQACIELAPDHPDARVRLAEVAIDQGDDQSAVATLGAALEAGCSSPKVYGKLATALMHLGKLDQAEDVLQKGLAAFPHSPEDWHLLGQVQIQRSEFAQAERSLRNAIQAAPNYTEAYYALSTACARQGKQQQAAGFRKQFAKLQAADRKAEDRRLLLSDLDIMRQRTAAALCGAGNVCFRHGDPVEAERLLLRAVAIDPAVGESYKVLSSLYQRLGRLDDALVVQRRLVKIDPRNVLNYVNLANLLARQGDVTPAEEALQQAIQIRPEAAIAYACLAQLYLETGKPEQARSTAQMAVSRQATAAGYALLASACRQMGDAAGAETALAEARKLASHDRPREPISPRQPQPK